MQLRRAACSGVGSDGGWRVHSHWGRARAAPRHPPHLTLTPSLPTPQVFNTRGLDPARRKDLLNEVLLLAALDHPHIVRFREAFLSTERQELCVVTELLTGGTLADLIRRRAAARQHLPEQTVWRLFLQICSAVQHLHANSVCHRGAPCMTRCTCGRARSRA